LQSAFDTSTYAVSGGFWLALSAVSAARLFLATGAAES
jgi:hypothetical protein